MAERLIRAVHRAGAGSLRATLFQPADPAGLAAARPTIDYTIEDPDG